MTKVIAVDISASADDHVIIIGLLVRRPIDEPIDELIVPDFHMALGTAKTEFLDRFIEDVVPASR